MIGGRSGAVQTDEVEDRADRFIRLLCRRAFCLPVIPARLKPDGERNRDMILPGRPSVAALSSLTRKAASSMALMSKTPKIAIFLMIVTIPIVRI